MVPRKILVIDDYPQQARELAKLIETVVPGAQVAHASTEESILEYIENSFYNLAVLDIRMDNFNFNGIDLAKRILDINPFAKILFVSAFKNEYMREIAPILKNGNILDFIDKNPDYDKWGEEIKRIILPYYESIDADPTLIKGSLESFYSDVKDEKNAYRRGERFEYFITMLFRNMGFTHLRNRVRDKSLNEIDIIIRNDIDDNFISRMGAYFLIECKNHTDAIGKNDFILFKSKLDHANGLANMGFIFTTTTFKNTVNIEAIRSSAESPKVIFIDNPRIMRLINSDTPLEELKTLIDEQVKNN